MPISFSRATFWWFNRISNYSGAVSEVWSSKLSKDSVAIEKCTGKHELSCATNDQVLPWKSLPTSDPLVIISWERSTWRTLYRSVDCTLATYSFFSLMLTWVASFVMFWMCISYLDESWDVGWDTVSISFPSGSRRWRKRTGIMGNERLICMHQSCNHMIGDRVVIPIYTFQSPQLLPFSVVREIPWIPLWLSHLYKGHRILNHPQCTLQYRQWNRLALSVTLLFALQIHLVIDQRHQVQIPVFVVLQVVGRLDEVGHLGPMRKSPSLKKTQIRNY